MWCKVKEIFSGWIPSLLEHYSVWGLLKLRLEFSIKAFMAIYFLNILSKSTTIVQVVEQIVQEAKRTHLLFQSHSHSFLSILCIIWVHLCFAQIAIDLDNVFRIKVLIYKYYSVIILLHKMGQINCNGKWKNKSCDRIDTYLANCKDWV